tara:strand:- start:22295 stop:22666 length:372 start_codon:yes stop_codon:yes gene_type:complete
MEEGISAVFKEKFKAPSPPRGTYLGPGMLIDTPDPNNNKRFIIHLLTDGKYRRNPTYDELKRALGDLHAALRNLKKVIIRKGIKNVSMPRIGCGLDKLAWCDVEQILIEILSEVDVTISIYDF